MKRFILLIVTVFLFVSGFAQKDTVVTKKDRKRDVMMLTTMGNITIRLSDSTPLHRDNFLKLVKKKYYDSVLFHRVIKDFMIQVGDPNSKQAQAGVPLGNGGPGYTIPAEIKPTLFHKKGVIAAARLSDNMNPEKASSGSQFYLVVGKKFTDAELDNFDRGRQSDKKMTEEQRKAYKTIGGTPHLDQGYTVFGEVVAGLSIVEAIALVDTSKGMDRDRPLKDVKVISMKLVKRKKK